MTSGSARSHARLRASGNADMLDRRGRGMGDRQAADVLRSLDQAAPDTAGQTPEQAIAAFIGIRPEWSDEQIAARVPGCEGPPMVARVRGGLAAGRPPGEGGRSTGNGRPPGRSDARGASSAPRGHPAPTRSAGPQGAAGPPSLASAPAPPLLAPPSARPTLGCDDLRAAMPIYTLTIADGTTTEHASYEAVRQARARAGGGRILAVDRSTASG